MDLSVGRFSARTPLSPRCSRKNDDGQGDRLSTDWDRAWSSFRKQGKKSLLSRFNLDKYVSWNPRRSEYPLSEEVDPIKRAERSNLMLWTSPKFTLIGAIIVVSVLILYTLSAPVKSPQSRAEMASTRAAKSRNSSLPKRGQIKAKVLSLLLRSMASLALKAGHWIQCR